MLRLIIQMNDKLLYESLIQFFENEYYQDQLYMILTNGKKMSLRLIDWFITNYSKKYNIYYLIYENSDGIRSFNKDKKLIQNINVFLSYKSQLKAYSKKKFDPFCRRERINFHFKNNEIIETTIGQLNFFRWAFENLVIDFIHNHKGEIEDDMNTCLKEIKNTHIKTGERKKRQELSLSATRGLSRTNVSIKLNFD